MAKYRNTDKNQKEIVKQLRAIPGISVETDKDDILVGRNGKTYWFEIKNPNEIRKDGQPYNRKNKTRGKQKELSETWRGHYSIVSTLDQILSQIMGKEIELDKIREAGL